MRPWGRARQARSLARYCLAAAAISLCLIIARRQASRAPARCQALIARSWA